MRSSYFIQSAITNANINRTIPLTIRTRIKSFMCFLIEQFFVPIRETLKFHVNIAEIDDQVVPAYPND